MNGPLKIGIDVDDVVADCAAPYLRAFAAEFGVELPDGPIGWQLLDAYADIPKEEKDEFRARLYGGPFFSQLECYAGCADAIARLAEAGHTIHFITARSERRRAVTEEWLARHGLLRHASGVHLRPLGDFVPRSYEPEGRRAFESGRAYDASGSAEYKVDKALNLALDAFCEDDPLISKRLAEARVRVFVFDRPWNADVAHERITRVRDWRDLVHELAP